MPARTKRKDTSDDPRRDDAQLLYDELTDDLLYDPAIGRATMMGFPCIRLAGKFLASWDNRTGDLVVKLPRERVTELVGSGKGQPFAPAGRVFREWVALPEPDRRLWKALIAEAVDFARSSLNDGKPTGAASNRQRPKP